MQAYKPQRILVTGGRGFLGRYLVPRLKTKFPEAEIVSVDVTPLDQGDESGLVLDLTQVKAWQEIGHVDLIFQLAAYIPWRSEEAEQIEAWRTNLNLIEGLYYACQKWRPTKVVMASTIAVYPMGAARVLHEGLVPHPDSLYAAAKLAGEHLIFQAQAFQTQVTCLRLSSLYGPGQYPGNVLPMFLHQALAGQDLTVFGRGQRTQDFIHVIDAVEGFLAAAQAEYGGTYNLASGQSISMLKLAELIIQSTGVQTSKVQIVGKQDKAPSVEVDIAAAQSRLGFQPGIRLSEGIQDYVKTIVGG